MSYIAYAVGDAGGTTFTVLLQVIELNPTYGVSNSGTTCGTGTISASATDVVPQVPFNVFLSGATPNATAFFIWGDDNTTIGGAPLPVDLTPFGAPNCFFYNNALFTAPLSTNGIGLASITLTLPANTGPFLRDLYFQWGYTSTNNPLGIEFTESLDLVRL